MDNESHVNVDDLIKSIVDEIWDKYDTDKNGTLEPNEAKEFILTVLRSTGDNAPLSDDDFEKCFLEFDADNNRMIEKQEMEAFIKRIAGY